MAISPATTDKRFTETEQFTSTLTSPQWSGVREFYEKKKIFSSLELLKADNAQLSGTYTGTPVINWVAFWVAFDYSQHVSANGHLFQIGVTNYIKATASSRRVYFQSAGGTTNLTLFASDLFRDDQKRMKLVVASWDNVSAISWLDGLQVVEELGDHTQSLDADSNIRIGHRDAGTTTYSMEGKFGSFCFGSGKLTQTEVDILFNKGAGVSYADLSAADKTALGLISFYDLDGNGNDAHGSNDLTAINTVSYGKGVNPVRQIEQVTELNQSGLLSAQAKECGGYVNATVNPNSGIDNFWVSKGSGLPNPNTDGSILDLSTTINHARSYRTQGCLSQQGDSVSFYFLCFNNLTYYVGLQSLNGTSTETFLWYASAFRENHTGGTAYNYLDETTYPNFGDLIMLKWNASDFLEMYINGRLIFEMTNINLSGHDWFLNMYRPLRDIFPPLFNFTGTPANNHEQEVGHYVVTENANDILEGGLILDANPNDQPEAIDATISEVLNKYGLSGIAESGQEATKKTVDGFSVIELNSTAINYKDILEVLGDAANFLVNRRDSSILDTDDGAFWGATASHPNNLGNFQETFGLESFELITPPLPLTQRQLYSIKSSPYDWHAFFDNTLDHSETNKKTAYKTSDFVFGRQEPTTGTVQKLSYIYRWLLYERNLNPAEHEHNRKALGNVYITSSAEVPPQMNLSVQPTASINETISLIDSSSFLYDTVLIEWGDGNTSNVLNATHAYTEAGNYGIKVTATNAFGTTVTNLAISVIFQIDETTLPDGIVGTLYDETLTAAGADSFELFEGSLPAGLTLNGATGQITGTPTTEGLTNFTILARSGSFTTTRNYSVFIEDTGQNAFRIFGTKTKHRAGEENFIDGETLPVFIGFDPAGGMSISSDIGGTFTLVDGYSDRWTFRPPNETRTHTISIDDGSTTEQLTLQVESTLPIDANWFGEDQIDRETTIEKAKGGTEYSREEDTTKYSNRLDWVEIQRQEMEKLFAFWRFHRKVIPFWFVDRDLQESYLLKFTSEIKRRKDGGDSFSLFANVRGDDSMNPLDYSKPTVSFIEPTTGQNVSGFVTITAKCIDNVGIKKVEFLVDDVLIKTIELPPWKYTFDTRTVSDGTRVFKLIAYDFNDQASDPATINVTVNN